MNITTMEDWLKTTIPGIIVLGAVGSIVAVCVVKGVSMLLFKYWPQGVRAFHGWQYRLGFRHGFFLGVVHSRQDVIRLTTYLAFHLACLSMSVGASLAFSSALAVAFLRQSSIALTIVTFALSFLSCLGAISCYYQFGVLRSAYRAIIIPILDRADDTLEKKKGAEPGATDNPVAAR